MKRLLAILTVAGFAVLTPAGAGAQTGTVQISWDQCDPIVLNKDMTTGVANVIASALGTVSNHKAFELHLRVGGGGAFPNAWQFNDTGCQLGQLSISNSGSSKTCPAFGTGAPAPIFQYALDQDLPDTATLEYLVAYGATTPDVAQRYTMAQIQFNHAFTVAGPADPAVACGDGDVPMCLWLSFAQILLLDNTKVEMSYGSTFLTWNGQTSPTACPAVQNESSTWGRVKGLYR